MAELETCMVSCHKHAEACSAWLVLRFGVDDMLVELHTFSTLS